jgi:hypothetical protein
MRERRAEDAAALALVGRRAVHLNLLDDQYRSSALSAHAIAERIDKAVDPGAALYAPGAFDGHVDHVLVRDAALELARLGRSVTIYADLPHAILGGWPAWVSGDGGSDVAADWDRVLARAGLATEQLVHDVCSLNARARARKLLALAAYGTQRAALDRAGFAPLGDPRVLAWEVSWEVTASALGGAREVSPSAPGARRRAARGDAVTARRRA